MKILISLVLYFVFLLENCNAFSDLGKPDKYEAKHYAIYHEFSDLYNKVLDNCNEIQDISRLLCKAENSSSCCALFTLADFCVGKCDHNGLNTQASVGEFFEAIALANCIELVAENGDCLTSKLECRIIKLLVEICVTKFPILVSPITSPVTTSPATSPTTSRPTGVFYCDVLGVTGRVQMSVSVWCDGTDDCTAHKEDEQTANCDGCSKGMFKCGTTDTTCMSSTLLCDDKQDCANNFDESSPICALP